MLIVLVAGIPAALIVFGGNPTADVPPLPQWFTRRDDGTLFLAAVTLVGWLAWASMTVALAIEVVAAVRGTTATRLRGLGLQQTMAAALISGSLMLFATHHGAGPAAAGPITTHVDPDPADAAHTAAGRAQINPLIVSQPGDSLHTLAAQYLADASRAGELAAINPSIDPTGFLPAGTVVTLPAGATPTASGRPHLMAVRAVTAGASDTIARLALTYLGTAHRSNEIAALNPHAARTDGTIPPGTIIHLPASPAHPPSTTHSSAAAIDIGGLGGAAAATFLTVLWWRRRRQHHARGRGHTIAMPPADAAATEAALTMLADSTDNDRTTQALNHLAAHSRSTDQQLPALFSVTTYGPQVTITVTGPTELPNPWHPAGAGRWTVDTTHLPDAQPHRAAPYPSLLALAAPTDPGIDQSATVLFNLHHLRHLSVRALTQPDADDALRSLAWNIAMSPMAANLTVTNIGFTPPIPTISDTHTHVNDLTELPVVDGHHLVVCAAPINTDQHRRLAARIAAGTLTLVDSTPTVSAYWILRIHDSLTAELVQPNTSWLLPVAAPHLTYEQHQHLADIYAATLAPPAPPAVAASWAADDLDTTLVNSDTALATADLDISPADDELPDLTGHLWVRMLGEPTVSPLAAAPAPEQRGPLLTELAVLLSLHADTGLAHTDIDTAIWPTSPIDKEPDPKVQATKKARRRNEAFSRLRKWMGTTATGEPAFPPVGDRTGNARYRLHPDVQSDWDRWNTLITEHPTTTSTTRLSAAIELVTAQPFTTRRRGRYGWAAELQQQLIATLTDTIEELAARYLAAADFTAAETTALTGIVVDSAHEGCWRIAILAATRSGAHDRAQTHITTLLGEIHALQVGMEEPTQQLLNSITHIDSTNFETSRR